MAITGKNGKSRAVFLADHTMANTVAEIDQIAQENPAN